MADDQEEVLPPLHLRPHHVSPDQDCGDMDKIVVTPVYRGRLEESHEQTRRAWRRRSRIRVAYERFGRNFNNFMVDHAQQIFAITTYLLGLAMFILLLFLIVHSIWFDGGSGRRRLRTARNVDNV